VSLNYDVFSVDPKPIPSQIPGFEEAVGQATWPPSTSTLIWGDGGGGLLVDRLITTTEAAALATWVRSHERDLEYIYITHPHADHLLGLPAVLEAYPNANAHPRWPVQGRDLGLIALGRRYLQDHRQLPSPAADTWPSTRQFSP
jgi:glyoxylase-like metal-dependent hydrolase (beta-lactamase superfamily II)